jgi:hypothetical protein
MSVAGRLPDMEVCQRYGLKDLAHLVNLETASFFMMWSEWSPWDHYLSNEVALKNAHFDILRKALGPHVVTDTPTPPAPSRKSKRTAVTVD